MRRWWDRYGLAAGLTILILTTAWWFRQSNGRLLFEIYSQLAAPFQSRETQVNELVNARVEELLNQLAEQKRENANLRSLIDTAPNEYGEPTFAPIIGRTADHWWQQILIGRGSLAGVKTNDVVTGPGGIVGRVIAVTPHSSRVLLVSDPTSRVGVTVSRSRAMGFMRGRGGETATLEFFDKVPDVREGDILVTSKFSARFPEGLPVGKVIEIDLNASPAPQAEIELFAPISALEWVTVYPEPIKAQSPSIPENSEVEILPDDEDAALQ